MKNVKKRLLLPLLLVLLWGCGEKSSRQDAETTADTQQAATAASRSVAIRSGDNLVATLKLQGQEAEITVENTTLHARARKGEKRKYEEGSSIIAEIKYSDDGFKLRDSEGQLRWKVKIHDDKIKISNNEEGDNAYQLKESESGKIKVKQNDTEIGAAKSGGGSLKISTEDGSLAFEVADAELQKAYAVLVIREIPIKDRMIILNELLK